MPETYDVTIIGAGHNGLTTAGYLARAGLKPLVLERRHVIGGACVTEEIVPGFQFSTCSYVVSLLQPKVIRDLELDKYGLKLIARPALTFVPYPDGRYLLWAGTHEEVKRQFAKFSERDARNRDEFERVTQEIAGFVGSTLLMTPPRLDFGLRDAWGLRGLANSLRKMDLERRHRLLDLMTQSADEFLSRWFESTEIKAMYALSGIVGTPAGPRTPGTAYVLLHHAFGEVNGVKGDWGIVQGGMGGITQAMARSAEAYGAEIRVNSEVDHIIVENGEAGGVVLKNGDELRAKAVISNADPKRTFLKLVKPEHLDHDFREEIQAYRCESFSFKVNLALSELPDFTCLPGKETGVHHTGSIYICPSIEYMERAWDDAKYGHWSRGPVVEASIPTTLDPTLAPPGRHVMSMFVQHAPYHLKQGSWDEEKEEFADQIIDVFNQYAPNFRASIIGRHVLSPLDLEREYGLTGGDIFHGALSPDQMFSARPLPGYADYRTPIRRLYLCGSGTHPGGGVMGAPGHNAAREFIKDWKGGKWRWH